MFVCVNKQQELSVHSHKIKQTQSHKKEKTKINSQSGELYTLTLQIFVYLFVRSFVRSFVYMFVFVIRKALNLRLNFQNALTHTNALIPPQ